MRSSHTSLSSDRDIPLTGRDEKRFQNSEPVKMDGGLRAWATVLGGFLTTTVTFGYSNAFGVYQDIYTRTGTSSTSNISWIGSSQLFLLLAIGLPAGKLLDAGYFRPTMIVGTVLYVFSLCMVSIAHHDKYYQIYLSQGLGMGIGAGLLYIPAMAIQAHHWERKRALAMGIVISGSSVGGIIFPIMLNHLFENESVGFAWGVRASAFLCLGLLAISFFLMTTNPEVIARGKPKPDMKGILTDIPYAIANFSVVVVNWGLFFPYFYLQLYSILHGIEPNISFYTLAIMNGASVPGRIIPNIFADKFGPFNCIVPSGIICSALLFALFGVKDIGSTVAFAILFGFFSGAFLSLCAPAVATLSRHPSEAGVRLGFSFGISGLGALTGTPIIGALLGTTFPWYKAIIFSGVNILAGSLLLIVSRQLVAKRKRTQLV